MAENAYSSSPSVVSVAAQAWVSGERKDQSQKPSQNAFEEVKEGGIQGHFLLEEVESEEEAEMIWQAQLAEVICKEGFEILHDGILRIWWMKTGDGGAWENDVGTRICAFVGVRMTGAGSVNVTVNDALLIVMEVSW